MDLKPLDILVCVNDRTDTVSRIKRFLMGRYEHVEVYLGKFKGVEMLYESDNRGVVIQTLRHQINRPVRVMRPRLGTEQRQKVFERATVIASYGSSSYDWIGLVRFAFVRVLRQRFGRKKKLKYIRDGKMICSEAVAEMFWRSDVDILPQLTSGRTVVGLVVDKVPVPADFAEEHDHLVFVEEGRILA